MEMAGKGEHGNHSVGNRQPSLGVGNIPLGVGNIPNGVGKTLPPAIPLWMRYKKPVCPRRCKISTLLVGSLSRASTFSPKSPFGAGRHSIAIENFPGHGATTVAQQKEKSG